MDDKCVNNVLEDTGLLCYYYIKLCRGREKNLYNYGWYLLLDKYTVQLVEVFSSLFNKI